jgi:hypothetical protein
LLPFLPSKKLIEIALKKYLHLGLYLIQLGWVKNYIYMEETYMDYTLGAITVSVTLTDAQGVDIFLTLDDLPDADFAFEQIIEQVREWAETNNHIVEGL